MGLVPRHPINDGVHYLCHPDHRNGLRPKSQWRVTEQEEIGCFRLTYDNQWIIDQKGWGLHLVDGSPQYLGVARDHATEVFVAKFVSNTAGEEWHGYPADHTSNSADRPHESVAWKWQENGFIRPAKVRKLLRGQPCLL
jgi:hypothetical protein